MGIRGQFPEELLVTFDRNKGAVGGGFSNDKPMIINGICYEQSTNSHTYDVVDDIGKLYISFVRDITPIPLTEEILLKCGFEKNKHNEHTDNYNLFPLQIFHNIANGFEYFHGQLGGKFLKIESLHQLQNLYFALTRKELEVKLELWKRLFKI